MLKFDQQIGSKHHFSFRENPQQPAGDGLGRLEFRHGSRAERLAAGGSHQRWPEPRMGRIVSPQMVVNARVSFSRYLGEDRGDANAGFDPTQLGFPASLVQPFPAAPFSASITSPTISTSASIPTGDITNTGALATSLNWNVRGHSIKFGADLRDIQYVTQNFSTALSLSADPGWTQQNYAQSDPLSGNSIASFLLGTPSSGSSGYSLLGVYK